jgi:hypothetical protein
LLIAEGIAPANHNKRKADVNDTGGEDEIQLQAIRVCPFTMLRSSSSLINNFHAAYLELYFSTGQEVCQQEPFARQ